MTVKIIGSPPHDLLFDRLENVLYAEIHESIDSTNSRVRQLLEQKELLKNCDLEDILLVVSDAQSAGRGRTHRAWQSPPGKNLYISVGCSLGAGRDLGSIGGLSLAVGMMLRSAFLELALFSVKVKWPNDLLTPQGKISGILIETQALARDHWGLILGIGINVNLQEHSFHLEQPWTSLAQEIGAPLDRREVLSCVVAHLVKGLNQFRQDGWLSFLPYWAEVDLLYQQNINVYDHQGQVILTGVAQGVNPEGHLMLEDEKGEQHQVVSGDIKVRLKV